MAVNIDKHPEAVMGRWAMPTSRGAVMVPMAWDRCTTCGADLPTWDATHLCRPPQIDESYQLEIDDAAAGHPCPGDKDRRIAQLEKALSDLVVWANEAEQAIQSEWGGPSSSEIIAAEKLLGEGLS